MYFSEEQKGHVFHVTAILVLGSWEMFLRDFAMFFGFLFARVLVGRKTWLFCARLSSGEAPGLTSSNACLSALERASRLAAASPHRQKHHEAPCFLHGDHFTGSSESHESPTSSVTVQTMSKPWVCPFLPVTVSKQANHYFWTRPAT